MIDMFVGCCFLIVIFGLRFFLGGWGLICLMIFWFSCLVLMFGLIVCFGCLIIFVIFILIWLSSRMS